MDDFLREIYVKVYRSWILGQKSEYDIREEDEKTIIIEGVGATGKVVFQGNVIELSVTNKKNDNIDFYLHFQMQTLAHASKLFNELMEAMATAENTKIVQVLLSCTSGLTTGFFAQELNQAADTLSMDYHFEAVPYNELTVVGRNCDIILLAPQIGYQQPKVQSIFHQIPVVTLPTRIFAKYDVRGALKLVGESLCKQEVDMPKALKLSVDCDEDILSIGIIKSMRSTKILYRVYRQASVLDHGQIIKQKLSIEDLDDLIDLVLVSFPHIKRIGVATPGIINNGYLTLEKDQLHNVDIVDHFKEKYPHLNIGVDKASDVIALTLYELQNQYQSLSFLYLPKYSNVAGMGNIFKGKIMNGHMDVGGDYHHLPFIYKQDPREQILSEEGCLDIVTKHFLLSIMTFSPDVLAFYCSNVVSVEDVIKVLETYVPKQYIPPIKKLGNIEEYLLFGEMLKCIEKQS